MHIRSSVSDISQRGSLKCTRIFCRILIQVSQFCAIPGAGIAVFAQTIKLIREYLADTVSPTIVARHFWWRRYAGIMKVAIGKERPVMAICAFCLAYKEPEAISFVYGKCFWKSGSIVVN